MTELWLNILVNAVLAILALAGFILCLRQDAQKASRKPAFVPVKPAITVARRTDFQRPVQSGMGTRITTRGPPVPRPLRRLPNPDSHVV